jgi:hypothetical protein
MASLETSFAVTILSGTTWEPIGSPHNAHDRAVDAAKDHYRATAGFDEEPQFFDYVSDDGQEWNPHIVEVTRPDSPFGPAAVYKIVPLMPRDDRRGGPQYHPASPAIRELMKTHKPAWPEADRT